MKRLKYILLVGLLLSNLTAWGQYDPPNPPEPAGSLRISLVAEPAEAGYFNCEKEVAVTEGESYYLYAYSRGDYRFVAWEQDGKVISTSPGLYEIRETSVGSNEEYVAAPGVIGTVTVTAGQIASPAFASSESTGPLANPGYVNVSPKGRFQLMKTDEKGNIITGSPATFQLYGPFETEQNINGLTEIPQDWMQKLVKKADGSAYEMSTSNGMATSIALEEGYYVLKETKEPDGYAIIENGMAQVKVAANTSDTELEVQNTPKIKVRFLKEGKVGNVTVTDSAQLTGAEFEIWDSLTGGTCLYGGEEGNPKGTLGTKLVTAVDGTGNPYTEYAQLAPGTYYYIETKAPEGFQTPDGNTRTEFTVSRGEETKDITVVNTADYGRI